MTDTDYKPDGSTGTLEGGRDVVRITSVRATPVSIPLTFAYRWGPGSYSGFTRTIVEVETADGITGIGESGHPRDAALINELIGPRLTGANALDLAECERRAIPTITGMTTSLDLTRLHAYSGIEMALWDIAGKASGRSVASLLGGRVREEVSCTDYFALEKGADVDFGVIAQRCAEAVAEHGARVFEGKVGVLSLGEELQLVGAVRAAIGEDIPIRLDANMSWDVATAREALARYADLGVTWLEEPVRTQAELLRLRPGTTISFSSHQIDLAQAVRDGTPDAFVVKTHYLGGIRRTVDFARACAMFGIGVWFRAPGAGVSTAAEMQISAALESITHPSQNLGRWHGDEVIEQGPFVAVNGTARVPDGPGLGVSLDRDAMERCRERARSAPLSDPYAYG
jgi:glucarate dehydratase